MSPIFQKLNLKAQTEIVVLNAPDTFEAELRALENVQIHRKTGDLKQIDFALAFVTKQNQVDKVARVFAKKAQGDAVLWFAYPKGTSKKYKCEFNRDNGWSEMGKQGFEPVRQVSIDVDWSALRFRRVDFIKRMTRSFAMTEQGKQKVGAKK